ncbi:Basic leucine zipper 34 [Vitis vinifera]|uniref:Basic leucine zipper 34 n=1 Tax=Vitis vinifera TaxID=29760 RepID=A0A438HX09_VITVI|nr:Basic leucine zipper 34 [Vitis vinifera]
MISGPPETNLPVALPFNPSTVFINLIIGLFVRAMDNSSGSSHFQHIGRWTALPHRTQLPQMPPSLNHYNLNHEVGSIGNPKPTGGQPTQSISSESVLIEEPPSWFEELLNEPDTPMQRGHRRSASDSLAYLGAVAKVSNTNEDHKFINSFAWPSFGSLCNASTYTRPSSFDENQNRAWESSLNCLNYTSDLPLTRDKSNIINVQVSGSYAPPDQPDGVPPIATKKQDCAESISHNQEDSSERSDSSSAQPSLSKNDAKRAKQQFAQRSRLRKLQYIAELEMSVQAEGCEISAAVEYLDQHNLILGMKNRALQQRLESSSQEYLIKQLEQDMLEREIRRLQILYQQQQQQQQQQFSGHRKAKSRNLDSPFSNTSVKT